MIYCLMVSGPGLTSDMRTVLFSVARSMVASGVKKQQIRAETYEGCVYTKGDHAAVGPIHGLHFTAVIDTKNRTTHTSYVVPTGELEGIDQAIWEEIPLGGIDNSSYN